MVDHGGPWWTIVDLVNFWTPQVMKPAANVPGSVVPYVDSAEQKDSRLPAAGGLMWIATAKTPSYPQVARFSFVGTHFPNRNGDVVGAVGLPMLQAFGLKLEKK
jgi:hypothetical protein